MLLLSLTQITTSHPETLTKVRWVSKQWVFIHLTTRLGWTPWLMYFTTLKSHLFAQRVWSYFTLKSFQQVVTQLWRLLATRDTTRRTRSCSTSQALIEDCLGRRSSGRIVTARKRMNCLRDLILDALKVGGLALMTSWTLMVSLHLVQS